MLIAILVGVWVLVLISGIILIKKRLRYKEVNIAGWIYKHKYAVIIIFIMSILLPFFYNGSRVGSALIMLIIGMIAGYLDDYFKRTNK